MKAVEPHVLSHASQPQVEILNSITDSGALAKRDISQQPTTVASLELIQLSSGMYNSHSLGILPNL